MIILFIFSSFEQNHIDTESESGGLYKNIKVKNRSNCSSDGKTRIRTVLTEKQLHTLR